MEQSMHVQKHFLPLQNEYHGVKRYCSFHLSHNWNSTSPQIAQKKQGVVFTLFELVIWRIEVSILIWTIIDTAKDNGDCTNIRKKRQRNCSYSGNKQKRKICDLASDLPHAIVLSESFKWLCYGLNTRFRVHFTLKKYNHFLFCALMKRVEINPISFGKEVLMQHTIMCCHCVKTSHK